MKGGWLILAVCFLCVAVGNTTSEDKSQSDNVETVERYSRYVVSGTKTFGYVLETLGYQCEGQAAGALGNTVSWTSWGFSRAGYLGAVIGGGAGLLLLGVELNHCRAKV